MPIGPHRAPVWPAGFTGSIAHTRTLCIVAVGATTTFHAIGFDMEEDKPLPEELVTRVATPAELAALSNLQRQLGGDAGILLFVAKEAFYKMRFAVSGRFLDFGDVEIEIDPHASEVHARLIDDDTSFRGHFVRCEGMVFCYFDLPAD
jgi:4'-phosphopantetheinyl transferase EntD